ncbi:hypothetical protein, partial [Lysobacter capsici]|uniref:hypothetical protein n=1 Tax=Lysobacter capsici TaxID=435897 RepID=UPI00398D2E93
MSGGFLLGRLFLGLAALARFRNVFAVPPFGKGGVGGSLLLCAVAVIRKGKGQGAISKSKKRPPCPPFSKGGKGQTATANEKKQ